MSPYLLSLFVVCVNQLMIELFIHDMNMHHLYLPPQGIAPDY